MPWLPEVQALEVVMIRPGEAEEQADVHRSGVAHHLDVAGRGQSPRTALVEQLGEALDGLGVPKEEP